MSKVDWSLAPEGATHKIPTFAGCWYKIDGYQVYCWSSAGNWAGPYPIRNYQDGSIDEMVKRPTVKPWSGPEDGLPPVGIACERRFPSVTASSWQGGIILAHGSKKIFFRDNCGDEWAHSFDDVEFRAIKTPEQLAAEQRETAIRELMDIAQVDCRVTAARLVDAGFKREVV
jgi:hypothetical protein